MSSKRLTSKSRRRACDACFVQKIRCRPRQQPSPALNDTEKPCRPCHALEIPCTFDRKAERGMGQGRQQRPVHHYTSGPSAIETQSSLVRDHPPSPGLTDVSCPTPTPDRTVFVPASTGRNPPMSSPWASFSLCSIHTLDTMLQNYFRTLYTLTPIIDQASLQSYFSTTHTCSAAEQEKYTFCLILSVCAYYTTAFPRRFDEYQAHDANFNSRSCREFLHGCETFILSQRPVEYFEVSTHEKCVTAYFLALSTGLVGLPGRAYWYIAEMKYHIQRLGYDAPSMYAGLDEVQSQLAKRMYWLYVVTEIHEHLGLDEQKSDWEPLPSERFFKRRDFAFLYSMQTTTLSSCNPRTGADLVSTGLSYLVKIYLTFVSPHRVQPQSMNNAITDAADTDHSETHDASSGRGPSLSIYDTMQSHLENTLDDAPQYLQWTWNSNPLPASETQSAAVAAALTRPFNHAGAVRANLHVSRIWAKSAIFERSVIARKETHPSSENDPGTWETRIRIGEELLAFIEAADTPSFEVNAPSITSKIRRIAAPLLLSDTTVKIPADLGRRVTDVLHRILFFLAELNRFSLQDTQFSEGIESRLRHR